MRDERAAPLDTPLNTMESLKLNTALVWQVATQLGGRNPSFTSGKSPVVLHC